jgi:hypothetical protein
MKLDKNMKKQILGCILSIEPKSICETLDWMPAWSEDLINEFLCDCGQALEEMLEKQHAEEVRSCIDCRCSDWCSCL